MDYIKRFLVAISGKSLSIVFFAGFLIFNLYHFITNFFLYFLNEKSNADEYYDTNLYSFSDFSLEKFFYTPSQIYIFLSSLVNSFLDSPKHATRLVSLVVCLLLILYFIKKISALQSSLLEKLYKIVLFVSAIFITNQMYIGTSDFFSYGLLIPAFLIILESIDSGKINISLKDGFIIGLLLALSIASRPTALLLIAFFYFSIVLILGFKSVFFRENYIIFITAGCFLFLINFLPVIQQNRIVLDVKEVPKETGVTWFQRNYLMAKFWDSNQIPKTQWVSTQDVIDFKAKNPDFEFPKNHLELLIKEPGMYFRQMLRMIFMGTYSSFRFMYFLFPLLFLCFVKSKKFESLSVINSNNKNETNRNRIIVIFHLVSIVGFSFIAVKMFEFRWIIPIMIMYAYYALIYLSKLPEKARFMVYTFSFISGILFYSLYFIKSA